MKKVELELPAWVWGRFASIADQEGTTVVALLTDHLAQMARTPASPLAILKAELQAAHRDGFRVPRR